MSISSYFNFSDDKIVFKFKDKAISKHFFDLLKDFVLTFFYLLEYNRTVIRRDSVKNMMRKTSESS